MNWYDAVAVDRRLPRREKRADGLAWTACLALFGFSLYMFQWQFHNHDGDLYKHAVIASEFVFTDLHSITSRLAYPLWHLFVSALFQLGVPLDWAAAVVCAVCKALGFLLTRRLFAVTLHERAPGWLITLCAFGVMFVTGLRIPGVNDFVYRGVGSPNVWHNPTQLAVLVTALLCVPYTLHCWYEFERLLPEKGEKVMLPWRKVVCLAALLVLSLACKPTFAQALIPAAAIFFLVEWIRHPRSSRYFFQIILAYLPAVAYFLLQYLYYTGVVVPFTSGVAFGVTLDGVWLAVRNMLMMAAFPLFAVLCCYRKGQMRDKQIVLCLLMVLLSVLEAMCFTETGLRQNHGNFNWASMSSAFLLWVTMLPRFIASIADYRSGALLTDTDEGPADSPRAHRLRSAGYFVGFVLLLWHLYSGGYYLYHLFLTGNTF